MGEGNHPALDLKFGRGYLHVVREEMTRRQLDDVRSGPNSTVTMYLTGPGVDCEFPHGRS